MNIDQPGYHHSDLIDHTTLRAVPIELRDVEPPPSKNLISPIVTTTDAVAGIATGIATSANQTWLDSWSADALDP